MWKPALVACLHFIFVVSDASQMIDVVSSENPYIKLDEEAVSDSVDLDPNLKAKFSCLVDNTEPPPVLGWLLAGEPIPEAKHYVKKDRYPSNSSYIVSEVLLSTNVSHHKTKLECVAFSEKYDTNKTASVTVNVIHPSTEIRITSPLTLNLNEGDQIEMTCISYGGYPNPKYSWVKEEVPLNQSYPAKWVAIYTGQNYTIGKSRKDSGKYSCVTHNLHPGSPLVQSEDSVMVHVNKGAMLGVSNNIIYWTLFITVVQLLFYKV